MFQVEHDLWFAKSSFIKLILLPFDVWDDEQMVRVFNISNILKPELLPLKPVSADFVNISFLTCLIYLDWS